MATAAAVSTDWVDNGYENKWGDGTLLRVLEFEWLSTDGGAVASGATGNLSGPVSGIIDHVTTTPGAGADAPTSYDMKLIDDNGETHASKTSASATVVESHTAGKCLAGTLYITITGAGDANTGVVRVYIRA